MCRGKNNCTEINNNPKNWDKYCPLKRPDWMNGQIDLFTEAVNDFINDNKELCLIKLSSFRNQEIQNWYIEHGQMSGRHRNIVLNLNKPELVESNSRDSTRSPKKIQNDVFLRDNYTCRYCGNKLLSQKFIKTFIHKLNSPCFKKGSTNLETHGIILLSWPVADHVFPWNIGGETTLSNLVTSCAPCNYGKDGYTLEQLGIEDPFKRTPINNDWDGLNSLVSKLEEIK